MRARSRFLVLLSLALLLSPALADAPTWELYTHPEKLMSVRFPGKPTESEQEAPSPIGTIRFKMAMLVSGESAYIATAVLYPVKGKFDVKGALDGARNQMLANIKGHVVAEKSVKLDGMQGRDLQFEAPGPNDATLRGVARIFASAKPPSAYIASAMQMTGKPDPDAKKFLSTFHVGKKVETKR